MKPLVCSSTALLVAFVASAFVAHATSPGISVSGHLDTLTDTNSGSVKFYRIQVSLP